MISKVTGTHQVFTLSWRDAIALIDKHDGTTVQKLKGNSEWLGGSYSDFIETIKTGADITAHAKAKAQFETSGLGTKIKAAVDSVKPRRRPKASDEDGDFDYSRRFEDKIFVEFKRQSLPTKIIDVHCGFSISASADASEINKYGAMVWSIVQLIESAGMQARVWFIYSGREAHLYGHIKSFDAKILVKEAGEYIAPATLAAVFSAGFYRRAGFAAIIEACRTEGHGVASNLGYPVKDAKAVDFSNGILKLNANSGLAYNAEIEKALLKALSNEGTKHEQAV